MAQPDEHATLVKEIRTERKKVRDCTQLLDPFVKGLAEGLDSFSFDEFEAQIKRGFMTGDNANQIAQQDGGGRPATRPESK